MRSKRSETREADSREVVRLVILTGEIREQEWLPKREAVWQAAAFNAAAMQAGIAERAIVETAIKTSA